MKQLAFFDTNIVVYTDDSGSSRVKQKRADALIAEHLQAGTMVISLQVLQEYLWAATRKLGVAPEAAQARVEILVQRAKIVRFDPSDVIAAIELHRLRQIAFWDALIVHAARAAGATVLYSEDLQAGAVFGGVRVVNPFAVKE